MRRIIITILLAIACLCGNSVFASGASGGQIVFETKKYDFGSVDGDDAGVITIKFPFTNSGDIPIIVAKADVSCSCMSAEYSKKPVRRGEQGLISVNIDTSNQQGPFRKAVVIKSNAENDLVLLQIVGTIK